MPKMLSIEASLYEYLVGFTREYRKDVPTLLGADWQGHAKKVLEKRRRKFIARLGNEELQAIASGELDIDEMMRRAAASHGLRKPEDDAYFVSPSP